MTLPGEPHLFRKLANFTVSVEEGGERDKHRTVIKCNTNLGARSLQKVMAVSSRATHSRNRMGSRQGYVRYGLAGRLRRWHGALGLVSEAATEASACSKAKLFGRDLPVPHIHCRRRKHSQIREAAILFVPACGMASLILLGSCFNRDYYRYLRRGLLLLHLLCTRTLHPPQFVVRKACLDWHSLVMFPFCMRRGGAFATFCF